MQRTASMDVRAYLNPQHVAFFACPSCRKKYRKDLSRLPDVRQGTKVKCRCACGGGFTIVLERRRHRRKATELTGGYHHERDKFRGLINVKNLSKSGARIEINASRTMRVGDRLTLKFNLDDVKSTFISKQAVIRKKTGNDIGVEFQDETWDHDPLAYYMKELNRRHSGEAVTLRWNLDFECPSGDRYVRRPERDRWVGDEDQVRMKSTVSARLATWQ